MKTAKLSSLEEKILPNITQLTDKKLVVSCSGGPDSMVLLDMLRKNLGKNGQKNLIVAHIHHRLRKSANGDEKIVADYCQKHKLPYEHICIDVKKIAKETKTTIEECARNIRKEYLDQVREKYGADAIVTAHHSGDQTETLLYRITKGTSITGLVGIESDVGYYIRPFLSVSKDDILHYAEHYHIPYGLDETNNDTTIPRNMLRHEVIPRLRTINPELSKSLLRLSYSALELKEGFDLFFQEVIKEKSFDFDWYHALPIGFQHECLRCLYEHTNGSTHGFSRAFVAELDRFLSIRTGGKKEFGRFWLIKKQGKVYLT